MKLEIGKIMHPSDLQLGDIVFFNTKFGVPDHVAMYTGVINGNHYVTHSVINDTPGLQTTILKNAGRMHVFRPVNTELGTRAAQRLLAWAKYRIPYDVRRRDVMIEISDALTQIALRKDNEEAIDYILRCLSQEAKIKFYERIKFAARRDTCPVKIVAGIPGRGFTCVQAVILAYQVEELVPYVKTLEQIQIDLAAASHTLEQITEVWISDKYCPPEIMERYDLPESYEQYAFALKSSEEFSDFCIKGKRESMLPHPHYHSSLVAWDYAKEPSTDAFIDKFDSCLDLPAKFCYTDGILGYMQKNARHWVNMGLLQRNLLPLIFSDLEKQQHYIRRSSVDETIAENRSKIVLERTLSNPDLLRFSPISRAESTSPRLEMFFSKRPTMQ